MQYIQVFIFCQATARQGQAEQLSKSRKKFLATEYKPLFRALYINLNRMLNLLITSPQYTDGTHVGFWRRILVLVEVVIVVVVLRGETVVPVPQEAVQREPLVV